ncbi:MAG: BatA domain-containing protein [Phycisphaeraceae bacterium]
MLNPLLLWFLPLALVPVILHLVTLRRLRTVELSTFRFLMDSYVQQRRRLRLLEWLIMLLRTAFVLLIILALARPIVQRFDFLAPGATGRDVNIILDTSPTMALRTGGTTSMQRATAAAQRILDMLGPEDHVRLIHAGPTPETLVQGFAADRDRLRHALEQMEPTAARSDLGAAITQVANSETRGPRLVYLISDLAAPTWNRLERADALPALDESARTIVMDVGANEPIVNAGLLGEPPRIQRAVRGLPVLLDATIAHTAGTEPIDTVLSVTLNDRRVRQLNLSLQPGERIHRRINVTPQETGLIKGRFELAGDAFPSDDSYLFTLHVKNAIRVLVVAGPAADARAEQPELYVRTALRSPLSAERSMTGETERQLARALAVEHVPFNKLQRQALSNADVVVLADVPIDAKRGRLLREYAERGGGLLIMPGSNVDPNAYAEHLLNHGETDTGLALADPVGDVESETQFMPITGAQLAHPVLSAFRDDERDYFETVRIYRHFPVSLAEAGERANVLLRLPDEAPLLSEARLGEGRVLLVGVPATPRWSNLPLKPEFVPMMLRAVAHLQRPAKAHAPTVAAPGQPAPIRLSGEWTDAQVEVIDPAGRPHTIELHRDGPQHVGAMRQTRQRGYYTVEVLPRATGAPQRIELGFAVNTEAGEGALATINEDRVRELIGRAETTFMEAGPDDPMLAAQLTEQREIWRTLIWLTFAIIGAEFLMSTLRPRAAPQTRSDALQTPRGPLGRTLARLHDTLNPVRT